MTPEMLEQTAWAIDPVAMMRAATGYEPDEWQARFLRSTDNDLLLLAARQIGKSEAVASLALHTALFTPAAPVLLTSPSERQSMLLFRKIMRQYRRLGKPIAPLREMADTLELANDSSILSLPGKPETIRGPSGVKLVIIDEAALSSDALFLAVSPMRAISQGRLIGVTTPFGKRGWFFDAYENGGDDWARIRATAEDCPRYSKEFLRSEKNRIGERGYRQEYLTNFEEVEDQVFATSDIMAAFNEPEAAWSGEGAFGEAVN